MQTAFKRFDERITQTIGRWPAWLRPFFLLVTFLGQPLFTFGTVALIAGIGFGKDNQALLLSGCLGMGFICLGAALKLATGRARPLTEYVENMRLDTFSFPSGHSLGAAVAYGLLAYMAAQVMDGSIYIFATSILSLLIVAIGISRIYLGAHYPTDVLGGWLLGVVYVYIVASYIQPGI